MVFTRLELEDFQSYQEAKLELPNFKTIFIAGLDRDTGSSNGAGKSSLKEAILFALYGKSKVKGADIIRRGAKSCQVSLTFEDSGKEVKVIRTRKVQTSALTLYIDGVQQKGTQPELQEKIQSILKLDLDSFITYSVVDRARDTELSKMSSTDLRLVLQDVLGLSKLQAVMEKIIQTKNELNSYLLKARTKFFPSTKRLGILKDSKNKIANDLDLHTKILVDLRSRLSTISFEEGQLLKQKELLEEEMSNVFALEECPSCKSKINDATKLELLSKIQANLSENMAKAAPLSEERSKLPVQISEAQGRVQATNTAIFKVLSYLTKLEESMKDSRNIEQTIKEQQLYTQAVEVLQKYITQSLTVLASQIEDQMNAELGRFSDLFCKINLSKTTQIGHILPTCYISIFREQHEYTYEMLSSGEQALISLIFKLVINSVKGASQVLFVDEGLDALDAINRERILALLESSQYKQVFIISHREDSSYLKAGQRILIRKDNGISSIL